MDSPCQSSHTLKSSKYSRSSISATANVSATLNSQTGSTGHSEAILGRCRGTLRSLSTLHANPRQGIRKWAEGVSVDSALNFDYPDLMSISQEKSTERYIGATAALFFSAAANHLPFALSEFDSHMAGGLIAFLLFLTAGALILTGRMKYYYVALLVISLQLILRVALFIIQFNSRQEWVHRFSLQYLVEQTPEILIQIGALVLVVVLLRRSTKSLSV
jgi:hypothetical protein